MRAPRRNFAVFIIAAAVVATAVTIAVKKSFERDNQFTLAVDASSRPIERIPPGLEIDGNRTISKETADEKGSPWSNIVLIATPRLGAGDYESTPAIVAEYAKKFQFVMLANVVADGDDYRLDKFAIGYAMPLEGKITVIDSATQSKLGAGLNLIGRSVLSESEAGLNDVRQIARTDRLMVFDAKAVLTVDDDHVPRVIRHYVSVDRRDGSVTMANWLLDRDELDGYVLADPKLQILPNAYHEDRIIHVDGRRFTFGIPSADAFALLQIPQGRAVTFTKEGAIAAAAKTYDSATLTFLANEISAALAEPDRP